MRRQADTEPVAMRTRVVRHLVAFTGLLLLYFAVPVPETSWRAVVAVLVISAGTGVLIGYIVVLLRRERDAATPDEGVKLESLLFLFYAVIMFFALAYLRLTDQFVGLETKVDALYFTVTTLATVGFGDIHAVGQAARIAVTLQMVFDLLFLGIGAKLVGSMVASRRLTNSRREAADPLG